MPRKRRSTFSDVIEPSHPNKVPEQFQNSQRSQNVGVVDQRMYSKNSRQLDNWINSFQAPSSFSYKAKRSFSVVDPGAGFSINRDNVEDNLDDLLDSDYQSHPSNKDDNSETSSLNDVCLPIDMTEAKQKNAWPDLGPLREFSAEEISELKALGSKYTMESEVSENEEQVVGFTHPIISKVDVERQPLLMNRQVDETLGLNGRLRPPKRAPWAQTENNNTGAVGVGTNRQEQFRFAYFREDLDTTIHSPTISGLLQPNQSFENLFNSDNNKVFWLDVVNPTEDEIKVIGKTFGIHPLTLEDVYLGETREKVELFHDYYFICFRSFDIVKEHLKTRDRLRRSNSVPALRKSDTMVSKFTSLFNKKDPASQTDTNRDFRTNSRQKELQPLNIYIIVFRSGVLTFHLSPTPHPVNVRRRCRLLRDYLTVSADWIAYALVDDITDAFGPMIESLETEVAEIEDSIIKLQSGDFSDSDESDAEVEDSEFETDTEYGTGVVGRSRRNSIRTLVGSTADVVSISSDSSADSTVVWKKKNDMLRQIGESRKKVMGLLRLLANKADVIKGFGKKCSENFDNSANSEIGMYLGDIQDHIITMVQNLNHCEKLLARCHSNYLAQINIDMTKVNNDMNDILGKFTLLGTIVLPMNVITGLWGMNVIVPGQEHEGLIWFFGITVCMFGFAGMLYFLAKRVGVI